MSEEQQNANTIDNLDPFSENTSSDTETPNVLVELQQALAATTEEAKGLSDKYLRLAAEFVDFIRALVGCRVNRRDC